MASGRESLGSSLTGTSSSAPPPDGLWGPDDERSSRPVLRAAGGVIPPADSPYFEAGRFTAADIHWATVGGRAVPAGTTEFARDATFGYRSSDLKEFIAEKSRGRIPPDQVRSISLADIRQGGPDRVAEILDEVFGGAFVVVNATDHADL